MTAEGHKSGVMTAEIVPIFAVLIYTSFQFDRGLSVR